MTYMKRVALLLVVCNSLANATAILTTQANAYLLLDLGEGQFIETQRQESSTNPASANVVDTARLQAAHSTATSQYGALEIGASTMAGHFFLDGRLSPATAEASASFTDVITFSAPVPQLDMRYILFDHARGSFTINDTTVGSSGSEGTRLVLPINSNSISMAASLYDIATSYGRGPTTDNAFGQFSFQILTLVDADGQQLTGLTYSTESGAQYQTFTNATYAPVNDTAPEPATWLMISSGGLVWYFSRKRLNYGSPSTDRSQS